MEDIGQWAIGSHIVNSLTWKRQGIQVYLITKLHFPTYICPLLFINVAWCKSSSLPHITKGGLFGGRNKNLKILCSGNKTIYISFIFAETPTPWMWNPFIIFWDILKCTYFSFLPMMLVIITKRKNVFIYLR